MRLPSRAGFGIELHPMKMVFTVLTLALAVMAGRAALPEPDLIARIHFAGARKISADTNSAAFTNEFCSAEALALRNQTADKLSSWLAGWLGKNLKQSLVESSAQLRPLFDDLQQSEWFLESRAAVKGQPEVRMAIQLDAARAQLWQASLKPFFPAAGFQYSDGWLFFVSDSSASALSGLVKKIFQSVDKKAWLTLDINWPRLAQWYPKLKELGLPETQFAVTARAAKFDLVGKFLFPEPLALSLEDWRIPTNTIHLPFVSFTAARGFSAWLPAQSWALPYQLLPAPSQIFVWALPKLPFQTFAAVPVPDAAGALMQAYARLRPALESTTRENPFSMHFTLALTTNQINFQGVPFVSPFLRALSEPAGQFLFAGGFLNAPRGQPLPPELLAHLADKNLLFYHWEITADRLPQVLQMSQLGLILSSHKQLDANSAAFKWVQKIGPALGSTITEIRRTGPAEMTFTRTAPGGFTAAELYALANWLSAANFPGCNLQLPPRPRSLKLPHPVPAPLPAPAPPAVPK